MSRNFFYLSLLTLALAFTRHREEEMKCDGKVEEEDYEEARNFVLYFCEADISFDDQKCLAQAIYDYVNPKIDEKYNDLESMRDELCVEDNKIVDQKKDEIACTITDDVKKKGGGYEVLKRINNCFEIFEIYK